MLLLYLLLFIITSLFTITNQISVTSCEGINKCHCVSYSHYIELQCFTSINATPLSIQYSKQDKSIKLNCNAYKDSINASIYNLLSELKLDEILTHVDFEVCPFPEQSFKIFMSNFNVNEFKELTFRPAKGNNITELNSSYLTDLITLEKFIVTHSDISDLQANLFQGTPNLKVLSFRGNKIAELSPEVFKFTPQLTFLDLGNNKLSNLDIKIFENLKNLRILNIDFNEITNLTRNHFQNLTNLQSLDISGNKNNDLPDDLFLDLSNLSAFQANKNNFKSIPKLLFSNSNKLRIVKLSYIVTLETLPEQFLSNKPYLDTFVLQQSNVTLLPSDMFWNSSKLSTMICTKNKRMISLPKDLFRDTQRLRILDLSENSLSEIPDGLFTSLGTLEELNLNKNLLKSLTRDMFKGLKSLNRLLLSSNVLHTIEMFSFDTLLDLKTLDLSNNQIQLIHPKYEKLSPMNKCKKLENLMLNNNTINKIFDDWFKNLTELKKLNLNKNNITTIESNFWFMLSDYIDIDLSDNQISIINLDYDIKNKLINRQFTIPTINLINNPITCDCNNYNFSLYYKNYQNDQINILINDNLCLNNQIEPKYLNCIINNNCPNNCKCSYWPLINSIKVNCSNSNYKQLPKYLPWNYNNQNISIQLNMKNNSINKLPDNVNKEYNYVTDIDLSYNKINEFKSYQYLKQLKSLDLSHNELTYIDEQSLNVLSSFGNLQTSSLSLYNNPWQCNCDIYSFRVFLQEEHNKLKNAEKIICSGSSTPLNSMSIADFCTPPTNHIVIGSLLVGFLGITFGIIITLCYKYEEEIKAWLFARRRLQWLFPKDKYDWNKKYDAFVSFAKEDDTFVLETLLPRLEKNFKICNHLRDFVPGEWIHNQIIKSVKDSRRTIIVLTESFLKSFWGTLEFRAAHCAAVKENSSRLIILIYGEIPPKEKLDAEMISYMSLNTYIKWGDPLFWEKLEYALPHPPNELVNTIEMTGKLVDKDKEFHIDIGRTQI